MAPAMAPAMALRRLSKKQFLPEEVQELIWEFGWHLNLSVIEVFSYTAEDGDDEYGDDWDTHYIYRACTFVYGDLPMGMKRRKYMRFLGIPKCFIPMGRPLVLVEPPRTVHFNQGVTKCVEYRYSTTKGIATWIETWALCRSFSL